MHRKLITLSVILVLTSFISQILTAQERTKIDSLLVVLEGLKKDTTNVIVLDEVAKEYYSINLDTFRIYTEKSLKLSKKLDYKRGMAKAYNKLAIYCYEKRDYRRSLEYYNKEFVITKELGDKLGMAKYFRNIGLIYRQTGVYDSAIYNFEKSLEIRQMINDETGITTCYNDLGTICNFQGDYEKAIEYFLKSLEIRKKLGDEAGIAMNLYNIGNVKRSLGMYDEALDYHLKALKTKIKNKDEKGMASSYSNIGLIFKEKGEYGKAIEYYLKALRLSEKLGLKYGMAVSYANIGNIHKSQRAYDKALEYFFKSLKIAEELRLKNGMVVCNNNIGTIYNDKGMFNKALDHYSKALKIAEELGDKGEMSNCYINIGTIFSSRGLSSKALEYYLKSLKIKEEIGEKKGVVIANSGIASLYMSMADSTENNKTLRKNYLAKSIEYGLNSYLLAKKIGAQPKISEVAKILMDAYKKNRDYRNAFKFSEIYIATKDSLFNKEKTEAIQEMETKYETEKKNVEIKELKIKDLENENIKRLFLLIIISLGVISVILFFFFRQKVKTNKILDKKNYQLNKLNETQSRLMSIISHDLKAPLSAFFSITSSLKSKIDKMDSKAIDDYFNRMLNSALAVKLQLENLLVWSITQTTDINVHKNAYNLSILVQKVIVILEEFSNEKTITLENKVDENIEINTDGRLLSIVLNNITTNAIKFSENNSNVEITATKTNDKKLITVKDFGCGMSKENLRNLFDGKNNMKHANKGTGLGLIVCKDIVTKLGGEIWAESKEGEGTIFYVKLDD